MTTVLYFCADGLDTSLKPLPPRSLVVIIIQLIQLIPFQRKNGLFKKAYELGVLCSVDVAVIIFGSSVAIYPPFPLFLDFIG